MDNTSHAIPFLEDVVHHPVYGSFFDSMSNEAKKEIELLIHEYITEKIMWLKTKWWELFRRFFENNAELFWSFRELNNSEDRVKEDKFQELGTKVEEEMFRLENILTAGMMRKPQWLSKTIGAFYDIVYNFFPLYNSID